MVKLRTGAVAYIDGFDPKVWHDQPVQTILKGVPRGSDDGSSTVDTTDAFGVVNGRQIQSATAVVDEVIAHCKTFQSASKDNRAAIRAIEDRMLSVHSSALIGNQALDFCKQDGVTEIEESIEANPVEQVTCSFFPAGLNPSSRWRLKLLMVSLMCYDSA